MRELNTGLPASRIPAMRRKHHKTFADYLAIAISPVLIMALVGSLVFFLLQIVYEGQFKGRLGWTLFWFVFASVLVSRISIQRGRFQASLYGLALAASTAVLITMFLDQAGIACAFLAVIWWCSSKLTWDCTLIDEEADSSGEGLLEVAGIERPGAKEQAAPQRRRFTDWVFNRPERAGQPHAPGLWVIYFSIAALPVFGVGQLMIDPAKIERRAFGFLLLALYLACALGLLLSTSFLGLRRYLRQRRLQMPGVMARRWVGTGAMIAAIVLLSGILLPRPNAEYSLTSMAGKLGSQERELQEGAFFDERGQGEGGSWRNGLSRPLRSLMTGEEMTEEEVNPELEGEQELPFLQRLMRMLSQPARWIGLVLRWLLYVLLAIVVLRFLARRWPTILRELQAIWAGFVSLLARLLGWAIPGSLGGRLAAVGLPARRRRFSEYRNPFVGGNADRRSVEQLVQYSFEAVQAWAHERQIGRRPAQTPLEFGRAVSAEAPELRLELLHLAGQYHRLAYGRQAPSPELTQVLERLWSRLLSSAERPDRDL